jgi:hypothetical protein
MAYCRLPPERTGPGLGTGAILDFGLAGQLGKEFCFPAKESEI